MANEATNWQTTGFKRDAAAFQDIIDQLASLEGEEAAPLNSPTFTGDPKAPTPATSDNDTSIATTAFVTTAVDDVWAGLPWLYARLAPNNTFQGINTFQNRTDFQRLADGINVRVIRGTDSSPTSNMMEFRNAANNANLSFVNASGAFIQPGAAANMMPYYTSASALTTTALTAFARSLLDDADATAARATLAAAPLASPAFTGTPTAPTPATSDDDTSIATTAFVQAVADALVPAGVMVDYAGSAAPAGWIFADGAARSRTVTYDRLFAAIGTAYGVGDGSTTFNVPDARGRVTVGVGTHADVNARGDADAIALASRTPMHAHTSGTIAVASHTHGAGTFAAVSHTHGNGTLAVAYGEVDWDYVDRNHDGAIWPAAYYNHSHAAVSGSTAATAPAVSGTSGATTPAVTGSTGSAGIPYIVTNKIIKY